MALPAPCVQVLCTARWDHSHEVSAAPMRNALAVVHGSNKRRSSSSGSTDSGSGGGGGSSRRGRQSVGGACFVSGWTESASVQLLAEQVKTQLEMEEEDNILLEVRWMGHRQRQRVTVIPWIFGPEHRAVACACELATGELCVQAATGAMFWFSLSALLMGYSAAMDSHLAARWREPSLVRCAKSRAKHQFAEGRVVLRKALRRVIPVAMPARARPTACTAWLSSAHQQSHLISGYTRGFVSIVRRATQDGVRFRVSARDVACVHVLRSSRVGSVLIVTTVGGYAYLVPLESTNGKGVVREHWPHRPPVFRLDAPAPTASVSSSATTPAPTPPPTPVATALQVVEFSESDTDTALLQHEATTTEPSEGPTEEQAQGWYLHAKPQRQRQKERHKEEEREQEKGKENENEKRPASTTSRRARKRVAMQQRRLVFGLFSQDSQSLYCYRCGMAEWMRSMSNRRVARFRTLKQVADGKESVEGKEEAVVEEQPPPQQQPEQQELDREEAEEEEDDATFENTLNEETCPQLTARGVVDVQQRLHDDAVDAGKCTVRSVMCTSQHLILVVHFSTQQLYIVVLPFGGAELGVSVHGPILTDATSRETDNTTLFANAVRGRLRWEMDLSLPASMAEHNEPWEAPALCAVLHTTQATFVVQEALCVRSSRKGYSSPARLYECGLKREAVACGLWELGYRPVQRTHWGHWFLAQARQVPRPDGQLLANELVLWLLELWELDGIEQDGLMLYALLRDNREYNCMEVIESLINPPSKQRRQEQQHVRDVLAIVAAVYRHRVAECLHRLVQVRPVPLQMHTTRALVRLRHAEAAVYECTYTRVSHADSTFTIATTSQRISGLVVALPISNLLEILLSSRHLFNRCHSCIAARIHEFSWRELLQLLVGLFRWMPGWDHENDTLPSSPRPPVPDAMVDGAVGPLAAASATTSTTAATAATAASIDQAEIPGLWQRLSRGHAPVDNKRIRPMTAPVDVMEWDWTGCEFNVAVRALLLLVRRTILERGAQDVLSTAHLGERAHHMHTLLRLHENLSALEVERVVLMQESIVDRSHRFLQRAWHAGLDASCASLAQDVVESLLTSSVLTTADAEDVENRARPERAPQYSVRFQYVEARMASECADLLNFVGAARSLELGGHLAHAMSMRLRHVLFRRLYRPQPQGAGTGESLATATAEDAPSVQDALCSIEQVLSGYGPPARRGLQQDLQVEQDMAELLALLLSHVMTEPDSERGAFMLMQMLCAWGHLRLHLSVLEDFVTHVANKWAQSKRAHLAKLVSTFSQVLLSKQSVQDEGSALRVSQHHHHSQQHHQGQTQAHRRNGGHHGGDFHNTTKRLRPSTSPRSVIDAQSEHSRLQEQCCSMAFSAEFLLFLAQYMMDCS